MNNIVKIKSKSGQGSGTILKAKDERIFLISALHIFQSRSNDSEKKLLSLSDEDLKDSIDELKLKDKSVINFSVEKAYQDEENDIAVFEITIENGIKLEFLSVAEPIKMLNISIKGYPGKFDDCEFIMKSLKSECEDIQNQKLQIGIKNTVSNYETSEKENLEGFSGSPILSADEKIYLGTITNTNTDKATYNDVVGISGINIAKFIAEKFYDNQNEVEEIFKTGQAEPLTDFAKYITAESVLPSETEKNAFDYRNKNIGFYGRESELKQLRNFVDSVGLKVWAVTGPGGIGKSKLVYKFAQELNEEYNVFWKTTENIEKLLGFEDYSYNGKKVVFVCDYVLGFEKKIEQLVDKLIKFDVDAKILFVERSSSWYQGLNKNEFRYISDKKYSDKPLDLTEAEIKKEEYFNLIGEYAEKFEGTTLSDEAKTRILHKSEEISELKTDRIKSARCLFVLLVTESYIHNKLEFDSLNEETLLDTYFRTEKFGNDEDIVYKKFKVVAYATAVDGIEDAEDEKIPESVQTAFSELTKEYSNDYSLTVKEINRISGTNTEDIIAPLKPDIIGEFLFLSELKKASPKKRKLLIESILSEENNHPFLSRCIADWFEKSKIFWDILSGSEKTKILSDASNEMYKYSNAEEIAEQIKETGITDSVSMTHYSKALLNAFNLGNYEEREKCKNKMLELDTEGKLTDDIESGTVYSNIAEIHYEMGEYSKSLEYHKRAIEIREKLLEEKHPDIAQSYNDIGRVYGAQGNYTNAQKYFNKALNIRKEILGEKHSDTATSYNNIGSVYDAQGDYAKALEYYNKTLEVKREVLGEKHPDTAKSYNNIGGVYNSQGNYDKALANFNKALEICKEVLGEKHPDTATSYDNIGGVYDSKGEYDNALKYHGKALKIRDEVLGEKHPDTASSYNNIGGVYNALDKCIEALEYYNKALKIREEVIGEKHPDTATSYNNIGSVYHSQGDYAKTLEFYDKALEICREVLGEKHPYTAASYNNIGVTYYNQGKYVDALNYCKKALEIREEVLGPNHPDTKSTYENIAGLYREMGHNAQALIYEKKAGLNKKRPPNKKSKNKRK